VDGAVRSNPTSLPTVPKSEVPSHSQEQKFMSHAPVIAQPNVGLDPNQTRFELKPPRIHHIHGFLKKPVGRPEMKMCIPFDKLAYRLSTYFIK